MGNITSCCNKNNTIPLVENRNLGNYRKNSDARSLMSKKSEQNSTIKTCKSKQEFEIWENLANLNLVKISTIDSKNLKIIFDYSDFNLEETMTLYNLINYFDQENNFFFLPSIFEILVAVIDLIQVIIELKLRNGLKGFFLIYFNKFILEKDETGKHRLKYTCHKINDVFNDTELPFKSDQLISSFAVDDKSFNFLSNKFKL